MDFFPPSILQRRPLTSEQQLQGAEQRFAAGAQPQNIGQGFQQLGNGIALGMARDRFNEGKLPHEQATTPFRRIAEALMGQKAPWQFPGAPQAPQQFNQNRTPQPWDAQPADATPQPWEAQPAPRNAPSPKFDFGNLFGGLLGGRGPTGGGLY